MVLAARPGCGRHDSVGAGSCAAAEGGGKYEASNNGLGDRRGEYFHAILDDIRR